MANELKQVQDEQLLEKPEQTRNRRVYSPRVDIFEKDNTIVLLADMPGTDETNINISWKRISSLLPGKLMCNSARGTSWNTRNMA